MILLILLEPKGSDRLKHGPEPLFEQVDFVINAAYMFVRKCFILHSDERRRGVERIAHFVFSKKKIGLSSFDCSLIDPGYSHGGRVCKTRRKCK